MGAPRGDPPRRHARRPRRRPAAARRARSRHELAGSVIDLQSTRERVARFGGAEDRPDEPVVCPYKGLAPFDRDDAEYFFGREELVAELVAHVVGASLLAVVGPSGQRQVVRRAGGSAARARGRRAVGQPQLDAGRDPARARTRCASCGARPAASRPTSAACWSSTSSRSSSPPARTSASATEFAAALARFRGGVVVVVVRADFYGHCAAYPEFSRALGANHVLVGAMSRDELRRAIERPGAARRAERRAGARRRRCWPTSKASPVRCRCCRRRCWSSGRRRHGRRLQLAAYARSGGVQGAVARLAEDAFVALDARPAGRGPHAAAAA